VRKKAFSEVFLRLKEMIEGRYPMTNEINHDGAITPFWFGLSSPPDGAAVE
jgi:hypothetical protein